MGTNALDSLEKAFLGHCADLVNNGDDRTSLACERHQERWPA